MNALKHIKLAIFTGLIVGILHGTIDIAVRIIVFSFEWFEFYQTLLLSTAAFTLGFALLGLVAELLIRAAGYKFTKKTYYSFYFSTSIILLLLFYVGTIINRDILSEFTFWSTGSIAVNSFAFLIIGAAYLYLLTKGKRLMSGIASFFNTPKIKKIAKNYIFAVTVFMLISLILDIYLFIHIPSSAPSSGDENLPNIILVTIDSLRADHLSTYGYQSETAPYIAELSEDAVVFENAVSPAVWTILSHGAIFTGKYVSSFDPEHTNKGLKQEEITLAEFLKTKGYTTAGFIGGAYIKGKFGHGQGFDIYKDRLAYFEQGLSYDKFSIIGSLVTFLPIRESLYLRDILDLDRNKPIEGTSENALRWLDKNHESRFFMFVHYSGPHDPYNPSPEFRKKYTNDPRSYEELKMEFESSSNMERYGPVSEDVINALSQLYDAKLAETDYVFGQLLRKLDEFNIKNNTIIIITADNGQEFYDHGYFFFGETLYQEIIHLPLIVYYPKEFKPKRIKEAVSTLDILPTVLDIIKIENPRNIDGISLLPLITGMGNYNREYIKSELFGVPKQRIKQGIAIIHEDWKLIEVDPDIETIPSGLYNLKTDPQEKKNLYDVFTDKREQLQSYLTD